MSRLAWLLIPMLLGGCGYHAGGTANLLPKNIRTIAIPAFGNGTTQYKLSDRLASELTHELIERTRYQVTSDPNAADAVLTGAVMNFLTYPTIFDPKTGRAAGVQAIVYLQISLRDRTTGTILFNRPNMEVRERYEISADPKAYFDESEVAMLRLSRDVARSVVSAILENF